MYLLQTYVSHTPVQPDGSGSKQTLQRVRGHGPGRL